MQIVKRWHQERAFFMALPPEKLAQLHAITQAVKDQELEQSKEMINAQDVGYTSKLFVQALFPYRKTNEDTRRVETSDGSIFVSSANGLPYGKYPRLIMAYIMTRTVENAGKLKAGKITAEEALRIPLGHSMNHFLQAIGIHGRGTGGERGTLSLVRDQLLRLSSSSITVQEKHSTPRERGGIISILDDWDLWFDPKHPSQTSITESHLILTPKFFKHIAESPIPIDLNILRQLTRPRSMDIYIWLTLKQFWLDKSDRDSYLFTWEMIAESFATKNLETAVERRDFRNEIKKAIHDVQTLWPNCGVEADLDGVTVSKTSPSVEKKPPRLQLD